jgi:hypothetical protein
MTDESTLEYAVDESAMRSDCDLWFAVPPGFTELPFASLFHDSGSPEGGRARAAIDALLDLVPEEKLADLLTRLSEAHATVGLLIREGLSHLSLGAHEADDGRVLESVLTLNRGEMPRGPRDLMAARAATARQSALPVAVPHLPCGPAAFTEAVMELPAEADTRCRSLYQATAYLPYPDGGRLAVLTLTSTAVDAREFFRDVHRAIAESVSFDNPLPEALKARVPESDVAASVRAVFG